MIYRRRAETGFWGRKQDNKKLKEEKVKKKGQMKEGESKTCKRNGKRGTRVTQHEQVSLFHRNTWHSKNKLKRHKKREGNKSGSCINIIPSDFATIDRLTNDSLTWATTTKTITMLWISIGKELKRMDSPSIIWGMLVHSVVYSWWWEEDLLLCFSCLFFQSCFSCCHTKWQPQFIFKVCQSVLWCLSMSFGWFWVTMVMVLSSLFYCLVVWNSRTREWIKRGRRWDS